jgi:phospho-2-dehydro-3-deoxyheptonate aldolase
VTGVQTCALPIFSVTDACIDWDTTERLLLDLNDRLQEVLQRRIAPAAG